MDENERARPSLRPLTESEKHASSTGWVALIPLLFVPVVVLSIANVAIDPPALRYAVMAICIVVQLALVILIAARIGGRGAR
ncbi:hypothetical protein ACC691_39740, partial [Rhizobium johnstonii]|uniref:hypothetical protein n=1 Tax=Rhizobium johnstonii TaxID=3019933 RepID=UPI003F943DB9